MGEVELVLPQESLEIRVSFDFVKKNKVTIFFPCEDANILKSHYVQYLKKVHRLLASSDKKIFIFLTKSRELPISRNSCWKTSTAPPLFYYGLVLLILFHINRTMFIHVEIHENEAKLNAQLPDVIQWVTQVDDVFQCVSS